LDEQQHNCQLLIKSLIKRGATNIESSCDFEKYRGSEDDEEASHYDSKVL